MKNMKWVWIVLLIVIVAIGAISAASAATGTPGSEADPVVTKSYVDKTVKEAAESAAKSAAEAAAVPAAKAAVETEIETLTKKIEEGLTTGGSYAVVNVPAGTSVIGKAGTEIIVRAGAAKAIDNGEDGVSDVTGGKDLKGGVTVEPNHLLLCPRDDGRGVYAASELWIMIRGAYEFK
ncbi:MAG: hypothetical protein IKX91_04885 [Firmicutes bacterium]|nr:hypothetical protein [Bacillota bacterium]